VLVPARATPKKSSSSATRSRKKPHAAAAPPLELVEETFAAGPFPRFVEDVPVEAPRGLRSRNRRGGARTPVPLLPLIALGAGVAIAYVAQTAHLTQSTYEVNKLTAQQAALRQLDQRLGAELDRLRSAARIDRASQQMGLRPPAHWGYVAAVAPGLNVPGAPSTGAQPGRGSDSLQKLVAALSGEFGQAEAAGP